MMTPLDSVSMHEDDSHHAICERKATRVSESRNGICSVSNPKRKGFSGILRLRTRVVFHRRSPLQKAHELVSRSPDKSPEFEKPDFVHLDAGVGRDAPTQVGAAPWCEAVAAGSNPDEAQNSFHDFRLS